MARNLTIAVTTTCIDTKMLQGEVDLLVYAVSALPSSTTVPESVLPYLILHPMSEVAVKVMEYQSLGGS